MSKINDEQKKEKLIEYSKRAEFWTNQSISQFGYSLNLFLTVGIAFIGFIVSQRNEYEKVHFTSSKIEWSLLFYFITLTLVFCSIVFGAISVISRLYDLRITRHIILVRKRALKKIDKFLSEKTIEKNEKINLLKFKIDYIEDIDYQNIESLKSKFEKLRTQSNSFGNLSLKFHNRQIIYLVLSSIIYGLLVLLK